MQIANDSNWQCKGALWDMDDKHDTHHKAKVEYLPTYRLKPVDGTRFNAIQVQEVTQEILDNRLSGMKYEPKMSRKLVCELANEIRMRITSLNLKRYKVVVLVQLGSKNGQHVFMASRCVWADKTDNFASASFQNSHLFGVATVYGLYQEW